MTNDILKTDSQAQSKDRRKYSHPIGRTARKRLWTYGPRGEAAKQAGSTVLTRGGCDTRGVVKRWRSFAVQFCTVDENSKLLKDHMRSLTEIRTSPVILTENDIIVIRQDHAQTLSVSGPAGAPRPVG